MNLFIIINLLFTSVPTTKASWYGPGFNGKITANGEIYNQDSLTAASPTLPFNTMVKITNIKNNKSVIVRINDRGPFKMDNKGKVLKPLIAHPKRKFDLSKASFEKIELLDNGIANINFQIIKKNHGTITKK